MVVEYLAKFLLGGLLVCLFALISEGCEPKQFAGLFSAAPSVLLASLVITLFLKGAVPATEITKGAIAGSAGMIVYCLVATQTLKRFKALTGSLVALIGWGIASFASFAVLETLLR